MDSKRLIPNGSLIRLEFNGVDFEKKKVEARFCAKTLYVPRLLNGSLSDKGNIRLESTEIGTPFVKLEYNEGVLENVLGYIFLELDSDLKEAKAKLENKLLTELSQLIAVKEKNIGTAKNFINKLGQ